MRGETGGAEVGVPRYPSLLGVDPDLPPPLQLLGPQCPPPHQGGCGRGHRGGGDGGQPLVISFSPRQTELEEFVHLHLPWASLKALQVKIWFPKQFQKQKKRYTEGRVADPPWLCLLTHLHCLQTGPLCSAMLWL